MKKLGGLLCLFLSILPCKAVEFADLSPEERLGQTLVVSVDVDSIDKVRSAIEAGHIGGVLIQWGSYSQDETRQLIEKLQSWAQNSPHKIPLLVSIDYEGGTVYTPITLGFEYFPTNMMLSAARNEDDTAALGFLAGQELRRVGVHVNFSPVLDVNSNPNNPIIGVRSFGSDVQNVTKMGLALMDGFQAAGIISVVKHFPGHGDTSTDSHYEVPVVKASEKELKQVHLKPFQEAISRGADGVMTGHVLYPALDNKNIATFSKPILQDLLRHKMGFKGLIVTDSLDMKSVLSYCTLPKCAVRAFETGSDVVLLGRYVKPQEVFEKVFAQVKEQQLQSRIDESAKRVFDAKKRLGLLDEKREQVPQSKRAYQAQLAKLSDQAVTLVRDRNKQIPVSFAKGSKKPTVCAVFFAPPRFADQVAGFAKPFLEKGWTVRSYNAALTPKDKDDKRVFECAQGADLLVLASLEWADKVNKGQKKVIEKVFTKYPKAILLSTMSPYDIVHYPQAGTVLATYGLNRYALETAANILLGNIKAQGKLPVDLSVISIGASPKGTRTKPAVQKSK